MLDLPKYSDLGFELGKEELLLPEIKTALDIEREDKEIKLFILENLE